MPQQHLVAQLVWVVNSVLTVSLQFEDIEKLNLLMSFSILKKLSN